jgi:methionyl-tRNA synthetase
MAGQHYCVTTPVYGAHRRTPIEFLYSVILADAIARHKNMCGLRVAHLAAVSTAGEKSGAAAGSSATSHPNVPATRAGWLREILRIAGAEYTHFSDDSSPEHVRAVEEMMRRLMQHGHLEIYKAKYEGRVCAEEEIYIAPSNQPANCPMCGKPGELISEDRYFFRLSAFQGKLSALYKNRPSFIQPQSRNQEMKDFVGTALQDFPISWKSQGHGVPWPGDPDQVVSRELSVLVCYLSGLGFGQGGHGSDDFRLYWPADLHVIAGHSLHQHTALWPALLLAAEIEPPLHIYAHGALSLDDLPASPSVLQLPIFQQLDSDARRYCLLRGAPSGQDARLSSDALFRHGDRDISEGLAQLARRVLSLVADHCGRKIPVRPVMRGSQTIQVATAALRAEVRVLFDGFNFSDGLKRIWSYLALIGQVMADDDLLAVESGAQMSERKLAVIHDACAGLGWIALLLHPVTPRATSLLWASLGLTTALEEQNIDDTPWSVIMPGTPIGDFEELLPLIEKPETRGVSPATPPEETSALRAHTARKPQ